MRGGGSNRMDRNVTEGGGLLEVLHGVTRGEEGSKNRKKSVT